MQCWHYFSYTTFLVWIFSLRDLFQVTGIDASYALYITCSQYITFEQVTLCSSYCSWFAALLGSPYVVLLHTCNICFWLNFIVQSRSECSLSCTNLYKLSKLSTEDSDHVIWLMVVLIAEIEDNCFYIIFSILLL